MAIDPSITAAVQTLNTNYAAAVPIATAPPVVFAGVRDNARDAVNAIAASIASLSVTIDTFTTPVPIVLVPASLQTLMGECTDQSTLIDLQALVGRARTNINLAQS